MDQAINLFQSYGVIGLFIVSFLESFISPVLPDLVLIPMALTAPDQAIYYAGVATAASVLGGIIGYNIGSYFGIAAIKRFIPVKYAEKARKWVAEYGAWAVFISALSPIPYKFISISAGVFRINMPLFLVVSFLGRAKRFLLEGILIYYYGPKAVDLISRYSDEFFIGLLITVILVFVVIKIFKRLSIQKTV